MMADCGASAHNGYAYIDGICEDCTGSSLGNLTLYNQPMNNGIGVDYLSNCGDIIQVCGDYTLPTICGVFQLDTFFVPGYQVINKSIDTLNKTFCFDFLTSNATFNGLWEVFVEGQFKNTEDKVLPVVYSNNLILEENKVESLVTYTLDVTSCFDNGTSNILSDDYYFVVFNPNGNEWSASRELLEYYEESQNPYSIGSGDGTNSLDVIFGPFLIQEGSWELVLNIGGCNYKVTINPPVFCSGCEALHGVKISNIQCHEGTPDTWSFDIFVPDTNAGEFGLDMLTYPAGEIVQINVGEIERKCMAFEIEYMGCDEMSFTVCPPTPCSIECDLEVNPELICNENDEDMYIKLNIPAAEEGNWCYKVNEEDDDIKLVDVGYIVGPFTESTTIIVYDCDNPSCFKMFYVPYIQNCPEEFISGNILGKPSNIEPVSTRFYNDVTAVPNPFKNDEVVIKSNLNQTYYQLLDVNGRVISSGHFNGKEYRLTILGASGIYFIKYNDSEGNEGYLKIVKL
jgi:hypothetical protein